MTAFHTRPFEDFDDGSKRKDLANTSIDCNSRRRSKGDGRDCSTKITFGKSVGWETYNAYKSHMQD